VMFVAGIGSRSTFFALGFGENMVGPAKG